MLTLAEQSQQVRQGLLDPVETVERCLARIAEREDTIRAWVLVDADGALAQANAIREAVARGSAAGSLLGAVVAIKDIVDVAGFPTRSGATWTSTAAASRDAPLVQGLRAAGAIVIGKTVTTELACFDPPPTRNPCNLERTPGGSSSGSAAAVADGMCQLAIGSQTGGSITRPASFCGVMGLKPTFGAVSLEGVAKVSLHLDHPGPIARCVDDLFVGLDAMRAPTRHTTPPPSGDIASLRLGRCDDCSGTPSGEVARIFNEAMNRLDIDRQAEMPASFGAVHQMHRRIMFADAAHHYAAPWRDYSEQFGECIARVIREGVEVAKDEYIEATKHQIQFGRDLLDGCFAEFDVIATPATVTTAPGPETTGDPAFNAPWSYCGFPTLSMPCGADSNGLTASIQWIARPGREDLLHAIGLWGEPRLA